jgi:CRP-like cAMP-binding protein
VIDERVLAQNELFNTLDESEKAALLGLALEKTYQPGEQIFAENQEAHSICLLIEGRVGLQMDIGGGRRLVVGTVDEGEIFAWSGLVPPYQFTATATAVEPACVAIFKSEDLTRVFDRNPRLGYVVMAQVAFLAVQRLRDAHLQLIGLFGS